MYIKTDDTNYKNIANAIRNKAGVTSKFKPIEMAYAILNIEKLKEIEENARIEFIDYDCSTVASYTLAEVKELTELPTPPEHDNLVFEGWNCTLDEIRNLRYSKVINGRYDVPATMIIYITIPEDNCKFEFECLQSAIDIWGPSIFTNVSWGDGSEESFTNGSVIASHTYEQSGDYMISITANDNTMISFKQVQSRYYFVYSQYYKNMVKIICFGRGINIIGNIGINSYLLSDFHNLISVIISNDSNDSIKIGKYAFSGCKSLISASIPKVTEINGYAFKDCRSLVSINISTHTGIHSEKLLVINREAFSGCSSLTSINIPDSVTGIGAGAFMGCSSLTNINIPNSVDYIGASAFSGCRSLKIINIPSSVTSIMQYAFENCSSLIIANSPVLNYVCIFRTCTSLKIVNIQEGTTNIPGYTFDGCTSLTSINIPNSVTSIGDYAFSGCRSLTSINIPDGVTSIGDYAFNWCSSLTSISIPDGVRGISNYAFYGCSALTSISIPDGVRGISNYAFYGCSALTSISIPDSVKGIGEYAFSGCRSLTNITIPDGVTSISRYVFQNCIFMHEFHIKSATPPALGEGVFAGIPSDCIIYVPTGTSDIYKAASGWSTYASHIQEENNSINTDLV